MPLGQDEERIAVETMRAFDADDAGRVQQILEAQPALVADFVKGHPAENHPRSSRQRYRRVHDAIEDSLRPSQYAPER
jgi:acyl carrier protein phosphodiesterase